MTELFDIPAGVKAVFEARGVPYDNVRIAAAADLSADCVPCDTYIFLTDTDIVVLSGSMTGTLNARPKTGSRLPVPSRKAHIERKFELLLTESYSLSDIDSFSVEEMISSARLVAKMKATADSLPYTVLIANSSNTYKSELYKFARLSNVALAGNDPSGHPDAHAYEDDNEKEELFCPKCGRRYADPERKICPHCMDKVNI